MELPTNQDKTLLEVVSDGLQEAKLIYDMAVSAKNWSAAIEACRVKVELWGTIIKLKSAEKSFNETKKAFTENNTRGPDLPLNKK